MLLRTRLLGGALFAGDLFSPGDEATTPAYVWDTTQGMAGNASLALRKWDDQDILDIITMVARALWH